LSERISTRLTWRELPSGWHGGSQIEWDIADAVLAKLKTFMHLCPGIRVRTNNRRGPKIVEESLELKVG
jgi:hypothetical protein